MPNSEKRTIPDPDPVRQARRGFAGFPFSLFAGLLLAIAHPPLGFFPLAWIALAPLIRAITEAKRPLTSALYGYTFGWAFLGVTWYWIALTIGAWTNNLVLGIIAWFGLTAILALFYAGFGFASWWIVRRAKSETLGYFAMAAAWVVMEWTRTLGTLTMPWAQLSYSQFRFLPLVQISDVTGAYGVSFLVFLLNVGVAHLWRHRGEWQSARFLWAFGMINVFACFYGMARLLEPPVGERIPVAVAQTGLNPLIKNTEAEQWAKVDGLLDQAKSLSPSPKLLAFAESDLPDDGRKSSAAAGRIAEQMPAIPFTLAINGRSHSLETGKETNSTLLYFAGSGLLSPYNKQQLVPFGEFIPYRSLWPQSLQKTFGFFEEDVEAGTMNVPIQDRNLHIGIFICYESMYPRYSRLMTLNESNLLLTQSNDAWFQSRAAQEQHLSAVVLRGVENRRDIVRSTTNGITCLIDAQGRISKRLPADVTDLLSGEVTLREGKTVWTRFGDWFVYACLAFLVGTLLTPQIDCLRKRRLLSN